MPLLRSGLTLIASKPKHVEQTNPPSGQLLDDCMVSEQSQCETVTIQPEEGNKAVTGDTGVEQGQTKAPSSSCAARVTVEPPRSSEQSDTVSDKPTDVSAEISIFLDKSLVVEIMPAVSPTSNDTSFGYGSQVQQEADHLLLVPDCHAEDEDKTACDSASSQTSMNTGVQVAHPVESDRSEPGQPFPEMTGADIGSAIMITDEEVVQTIETDLIIEISDDDTEQTIKTGRNNPRNAAKRSFKDFVVNDNLWMVHISEDLDQVRELTDYVLEMSETVVRRVETMRKQLIESQKYIRDCGGEEMKVKVRLENL